MGTMMTATMVSRVAALLGACGRPVVHTFLYAVDLAVFHCKVLGDRSRHRRLWNHASRRAVVTQIIFTGVDAVPAILLLAIILGGGLVAQLVLTLQEFGSQGYVVSVTTDLVALELGSLLTAILLIGRSGSAIAVDLLNMKLNNEIHALELLGININDFLIMPRVLGCAVSQLVLAILLSFVALSSAVVVTAIFASISVSQYFQEIIAAFTAFELGVFAFKNLLFGIIIGSVACFHGLQIQGSRTEIPQQTQKALVSTLVIIFILDGLLVLAVG